MTPAALVDAIGIPKWGDKVANVRPEFIDQVLVVKGVHVSLDGGQCTLKACPDPCCSGCIYSPIFKELQGIPIHDVGGQTISCGGRSCEKPRCPAWLPSAETAYDVVGTFRGGRPLRFELAVNPWRRQ
jgi:hypothetical protein